MAYFEYLKFDRTALLLPDSYDVSLLSVKADSSGETETAELKNTEMYIEGFKAKLEKDTSYRGLWTVSFTLKEF